MAGHRRTLGREVALKRALSGDGDPQRFRQLEREAKLLAQVNHRHVVTIYDMLDDDGECWLVMEYVPARSMAELDVVAPRRRRDWARRSPMRSRRCTRKESCTATSSPATSS